MEDMVAEAAVMAIYICPFLLLLLLCGYLADHVLPRCPHLLRFLERILQVDLGGSEEWDQ